MGDLRQLRFAAVSILGPDQVWSDPTTLELHSYDASLERGRPDLVVRPRKAEELRALVAAAHRSAVPYVMRGAGTGYSGGALPAEGGMAVLTSGLDRILGFDADRGLVRCEPGVVLADLQRHVASQGWRYPPDPSSHEVCTVGGNVAENAGGPHALGGGPTANYVTAVEVVRPDGSVEVFDAADLWSGGLDLCSLLVGAEGTLGAVAAVTLRLVRPPEVEQVVLATFGRQEDAVGAVTDVFGVGLLPSAMDMLTGGYVPGDAGFADDSLLFVGVAGRSEEVDAQVAVLAACVARNGGRPVRLDVPEFLHRRAELVRDKVGRMVAATSCPRYYLFDAVAPRSRLADLMDGIRRAATDYDLPLLNTFHAGDGNVHPTPFYDPRDPSHRRRLLDFSTQVLRRCAELGGSLSGEHGIGSEKRRLMEEFFAPEVLDVMRGVKHAFDPAGLSNPGKVLPPPTSRRPTSPGAGNVPCRRRPRVHVTDAVVEITDATTTFADVAGALAGTPYELVYEPLGAGPGSSVLDAFDSGLPGLREPTVARPRNLLVGGVLRPPDEKCLEVGRWCVKDVGGYELRRLLYGGRGRLGALVGLRLRLLPRSSDSRYVSSRPMSFDDACVLSSVVRALDLPFAYLGILVHGRRSAQVVGRVELRGGSIDARLERLPEADRAGWSVDVRDRWSDAPLTAMASDVGVVLTTCAAPDELRRAVSRVDTAYVPIGAGRVWSPGSQLPERRTPSELEAGIVRAFRGTGP